MKRLSKQAALILCICMLIASCVSGTLAYLTNEAGDTNTFVLGKIQIGLTETDTKLDEDGDVTTNTYQIEKIGQFVAKDPKVTVFSGSAPCWLFVELNESDNFDAFLEYEITDGWARLESENNVYYQKLVDRTLVDTEYQVLKNNSVKVKEDVTVEKLNLLQEETYPALTVKAYAIQLGEEGTILGSAEDAWKQLNATK